MSGGNENPISFAVESPPEPVFNPSAGISSSYDWSSFFKITRRNNGNGIVRLKKSLEDAFQVGYINSLQIYYNELCPFKISFS